MFVISVMAAGLIAGLIAFDVASEIWVRTISQRDRKDANRGENGVQQRETPVVPRETFICKEPCNVLAR